MKEAYKLSKQQQLIYDMVSFGGHSIANITVACLFDGIGKSVAIKRAIKAIMIANDALLIRIIDDKGIPVQYISEFEEEIEFVNFNSRKEFDNWAQEIACEPSDIFGKLSRIIGIQIENKSYGILIHLNHIVSDAWTVSIIQKQFIELYKAYEEDIDIKIDTYSYLDYLEEEKKYLASEKCEKDKKYWLCEYEKCPQVTYLSENVKDDYKSKRLSLCLLGKDAAKINNFCKKNNVSIFSLYASALSIYISSIKNVDSFYIGTAFYNRSNKAEQNTMGMFVNTAATRMKVVDNSTFLQNVLNTNDILFSAIRHQKYNYDQVLADIREKYSNIERLYDVSLSYQNVKSANDVRWYHCGAQIESLMIHINDWMDTQEYNFYYDYQIKKFTEEEIKYIHKRIVSIILNGIKDENQIVQNFEMITGEEKKLIIGDFNNTDSGYPLDKTVVDLFEEQVLKTPSNIAVVFEDEEITYSELNAKANQLARKLREIGVQPDDFVAMVTDRSLEMIIGIYGILKSGAAYVPIDPAYPEDRQRYTLEDCKPKAVLITKSSDFIDLNIPVIDLLDQTIYTGDTDNLNHENKPNDLAYVIYTSGTTGRPKGVMIEHRNVVRLLKNDSFQFDFNDQDVWMLFHSYSFDFSVWEIFGSTLYGGKLVVLSVETIKDPNSVMKVIIKQKVTVLNQVPSSFYNLMNVEGNEKASSLRYIIFGGEALAPKRLRDWYNSHREVKIINMYGITETTVHVTYKEIGVEEIEAGISDIGKAIPTLKVYILNKMNLCGIGVPGELCVSGAGVSRGYLNQPELTKKKFINNPFGEGKLYRSGDLARWSAEGNLEYLGRIDEQVKIRGFRIELGEIENVIRQIDEVQDAVVVINKDKFGEKNICAYLVSENTLEFSKIRNKIRLKIPEYMVPAYFMQIDKIPLTHNGKLDRKSLPQIEVRSEVEYVAPRNELEEALVEAFKEVLNSHSVGIKDNFFEIGGDSIKAIRVVSKIREKGYELNVKDIMFGKCIEFISPKISVAIDNQKYEQSEIVGEALFTPIQKLFYEWKLEKPSHFNQGLMLKSEERFDEVALNKVLTELIKHHDMLRAIYRNGKQEILPSDHSKMYEVQVYDFRKIDKDSLSKLIAVECTKIQSSFDLSEGPLIKAGLFKTETQDYMMICMHHLVVDGVSWRIFLEDFNKAYEQYLTSKTITLPTKTASYRDWANALNQYSESKVVKQELGYWKGISYKSTKGKVAGDIKGKIRKFEDVWMKLDEKRTKELLLESNRAYGTGINDLLLTALGMAINKLTNNNTVAIELEGHGRIELDKPIDIDRTVGWFTNIYPVVVNVYDDVRKNIIETKEMLRKVPKQGIGYGLLKYGNKNELPETDIDVCFNYLGDIDNDLKNSGVIIGEFSCGESVAKENGSKNNLTLNGSISGGVLSIIVTYNGGKYSSDMIQSFCKNYVEALNQVIEHCVKQKDVIKTASDFGEYQLDDQELSKITSAYGMENIQSIGKLTPMQEGMLYYRLADENSTSYFVQNIIRFNESFNLEYAISSINLISAKHDILRTPFAYRKLINPRRVVLRERRIEFNIKDLSNLDEEQKQFQLNVLKTQDIQRGFDLEKDTLLRIISVKMNENEYLMIWSFHHIIMDGWSVSLLLKNFIEYYQALINGTTLEELQNQIKNESVSTYDEYVNSLKIQDKLQALDYFEKVLEDYTDVAEIRPIGAEIKTDKQVGQLSLKFEDDLCEKIRLFSEKNNVTISTILEAALGILLQRYNRTDDVVFGKVVSGRNVDVDGIQEMIGLFINTIPTRVKCEDEIRCEELLQQLQKQSIESSSYDYCSLSEIQRNAELGSDLIKMLYIFENYYVDKNLASTMKDLNLDIVETREQTNYDLTLSAFDRKKLSLQIMYNAKKFSEYEINLILNRLVLIISSIINKPTQYVSDINMIDEEERKLVTETFNITAVSYPKNATINELFEIQAKKVPNKIAVMCEEDEISYKKLDMEANRIANNLIKSGVKPTDVVAIILPRRIGIHISMLGILKSGAAYIPIDPELPIQRIQYILEDSQSKCIITTEEHAARLSEINIPIIDIDNQKESNVERPEVLIQSEYPCYVIYTSGSSGKPKGTVLTHGNVANFCLNNNEIMESIMAVENPIMLSTTTISFDIFVTESLLQLLNGTTIALASEKQQNVQSALSKYSMKKKCTALQTTPSKMKAFMYDENCCEYLASLSTIILGGEVLLPSIYEKLSQFTDARIFNIYGPSETTVWVTTKEVTSKNITIGKPFSNTQIYIMNNMNICGIGMPGELCIAGDCVGMGYLNKPELTMEKFIDNPFGEKKMYRTGDLARWLSNGEIEYLGRIDTQIKIRGLRIELGEIENVIRNQENVQDAAVIVAEYDNNKYICAYLITDKKVDLDEIKNNIRAVLPEYMVPTYMMEVDKIPVTQNGKVNRRALPRIEAKNEENYIEPRNEVEEMLAKVFCKVLGIEKISINDNFFALGGDSIKSIQAVALLADYNVRIQDITKYPQIQDLSGHIQKVQREISQDMVIGKVQLTPAQLYLLEIADKESINHFNQSMLLKSKTKINSELLKKVLKELLYHHDGLRLRYSYGERYSVFEKISEKDTQIKNINCTEKELNNEATKVQQSLSIENGPLIKIASIQTEKQSYVLIVLHHWVCDGVSQRIIFDDFCTLYNQLLKCEKIKLPLKTNSFKDWSEALHQYARSEVLFSEKDYWIKQLERAKVSKLAKENKRLCYIKDCKMKEMIIDSSITYEITKTIPSNIGVSTNEVLMTAFIWAYRKVFHKNSKSETVFIESHGREGDMFDLNINRTLGWFTAIYPISMNFERSNSKIGLGDIYSTKEVLETIPNGGIGYSLFDKIISKEKNSDAVLETVLYNYMGSFNELNDNNNFELSPKIAGQEISGNIRMQHPMIVNLIVKDNHLYVDIRYDKTVYSNFKVNKMQYEFKKTLYKITKLNDFEKLGDKLLLEVKSYNKNNKDIATIINKNASKDIYVFPPAMLKIAYIPLFEGLFKNIPEYRFHIMHLLKSDDMDAEYYKYIINRGESDNYIFVGYSGGANIAFDTALYMKSKSKTVDRIIMLDGFKWEEGTNYVTISEENIDEMMDNFVKNSNIDAEILRSAEIVSLLESEKKSLLNEAIIYQEYCRKHRDRAEMLNDCNITNLLSEDVVSEPIDTRITWNKITKGRFEIIQGKGTHISMLGDKGNMNYNSKIIKEKLSNISEARNQIIKLKNIKKDFGSGSSKVNVLKGIDFAVNAGEFIVILGPSGSGKSTLLNIMSTLEKPTEGTVTYFGKSLEGMKENKIRELRTKHIGFIFQAYHLFANLTVKENVLLGEYLAPDEIDIDTLLKDIGLGEKQNKFPYQISGGEQQRVAIARALSKKTSILFCDEPTGALDTKTGIMILNLLKTMQESRGMSIVLVTHNPQIVGIADRVIHMKDGEIVSEEINENPLTVEEVDWL